MNADRLAAWDRWLQAAGPWQGWCVCPALLSPEKVEPEPAQLDTSLLVARLEPLLSGGVLAVLDLEPALGVTVAARLAQRAHPVLVLGRWPYAEGVLPSNGLVGALLAQAERLPRGADRKDNVVFVLDGQRGLSVVRPRQDRRADNRHALPVFELPRLAVLRQRGIHRVEVFRAA